MEANLKAFKTATFYLSADVADAGTFTVSYPTGTSDGDFEQGMGHYIMLNGAKLYQPKDIGLSFGDTSVTVTNRTGGTLPGGQTGYFNFNMPGQKLGRFAQGDAQTKQVRLPALKMIPVSVNLAAPTTASSTCVSASQSVALGAAFLLNGALATNGVVTFDYARNVVAAWTTTAILTITGTDILGRTLVETTASGTSHTGKKAFKTVTSVTSNASITSATIGNGVVFGLPFRVDNERQVLSEIENGVALARLPEIVRTGVWISEADMDAGTAAYIYPAVAGQVVGAGIALQTAVTTGGTITFNVAGGSAVVGLSLVVPNSAAAGDVVKGTPTSLTGATGAITALQSVTVVGDAAFNASCIGMVHVDVRRTSLINGTFVAGLAQDTKSTSTTADVFGTYSPVTTPDGSVNYDLVLLVPQPEYVGSQFAG